METDRLGVEHVLKKLDKFFVGARRVELYDLKEVLKKSELTVLASAFGANDQRRIFVHKRTQLEYDICGYVKESSDHFIMLRTFSKEDGMNFEYLTQPSKKWTFEQPKLKSWVESMCFGKVLNLFAGKVRLGCSSETRVDISDEWNPDFAMDCRKFVSEWSDYGLRFDTVILDPPYTWRKAKEKYKGKMIGEYPRLKNELLRIISGEAIVISLGWDTAGMAHKRGFEKTAVRVVCHGGDHRDTLCLVESRVREVDIDTL